LVSLGCHVGTWHLPTLRIGNWSDLSVPACASSRFAEICHVSLGPAVDTSYLKSRNSIANAGSFEMHPAIEAM
jgi:hypothetical protein